MKRVMDYIDNAFSELPDTRRAYKYKQKLIEEVTERANEITHAGIRDEKVIEDLIISEHKDIKADYEENEKEYIARKKEKQKVIFRIVGSIVYFIAIVVIFLSISLLSGEWAKSALIIILGGLSLYVAYVLVSLVKLFSHKHFIFKQFGRVLLYGSVFAFAVPLFLILRLCFDINEAWIVFLFAVIAGFSADGIYDHLTGDRFAVYFHILYIVPTFAITYVILSYLRFIPWHPGWIMIPASLLVVGLAILYRLKRHYDVKIEEPEDDEQWNEEN